MPGSAGDKMIQMLLPFGLLPLTLCIWVTDPPRPRVSQGVAVASSTQLTLYLA